MGSYPVSYRRGANGGLPRYVVEGMSFPANDNGREALNPKPSAHTRPSSNWPKQWPRPANDNWPRPANDNRPRTTLSPTGQVARIVTRASSLAIQVGLATFVGGLPGLSQNRPAVYAHGDFSWCANPGGFGPPRYSATQWLPTNQSLWDGQACLGGQAISSPQVNPTDAQIDLGGGAYRVSAWRWDNLAHTRYSHLWSLKGRAGAAAPLRESFPKGAIRSSSSAGPKLPAPPPSRTKEKKMIMAVDPRSFLGRLLNGTTEAIDFIMAIADGLPPDVRRDLRGRPLHEILEAIYDNFDAIDWGRAVRSLIQNQVEDYILGRAGRLLGRANRRNAGAFGIGDHLGAGPAL